MSEKFHTSIGELHRVGIDALRGLGYSFGSAERISRVVGWAEAVTRCGLRFVVEQHPFDRKPQRVQLKLEQRSLSGTPIFILDAAGESILDSGPRSFDLANATARTNGVGIVVIRRTFGADLIGELLVRSARRGLTTAAITFPGEHRKSEPTFDDGAVWFSSAGDLLIAAKSRDQGPLMAPREFVSSLVEEHQITPIAEALDLAMEPAGPGSDILIVSVPALDSRRYEKAYSEFANLCTRSNFILHPDYIRTWEQSLKCGLDVDAGSWKLFSSLVSRIRVAASEKSLGQAG